MSILKNRLSELLDIYKEWTMKSGVFIPILIFIVPLLDLTIVIDWKFFFCRSDPGNALMAFIPLICRSRPGGCSYK